MIRLGRIALVVFLAAPLGASAQSASDLAAAGIRAYRGLDYEAATTQLRRALASTQQPLANAPRVEALGYLAAAEVFRGREDSALVVFRRAWLLDPRYRPDGLVFPPEVTDVFVAAMYRTKMTGVIPVGSLEFVAGTGRVAFRLLATSAHDIEAAIRREDGQTVRVLYRGAIGDSLDIGWNGLDSADAAVRSGRYVLFVNSEAGSGGASAQVQVPLDVFVQRRDTLTQPAAIPDSAYLPERIGGRRGLRSLGGGVLAGVVIAALPALVADGSETSRVRFALAGGVSLAGILGFLSQRSDQPNEANIRANAELRRSWLERADSVSTENEIRRADVRVRVVPGSPLTVLRERP